MPGQFIFKSRKKAQKLSRYDCGILKRRNGPALFFLRHYYRKQSILYKLLSRAISVTVDMDHGNVRSKKSDLFDVETQRRVFKDRVEYLLMGRLDRFAALEVHAINHDVIRVVSERLREERAAFRVPSRLQALYVLTNGCFICAMAVLSARPNGCE